MRARVVWSFTCVDPTTRTIVLGCQASLQGQPPGREGSGCRALPVLRRGKGEKLSESTPKWADIPEPCPNGDVLERQRRAFEQSACFVDSQPSHQSSGGFAELVAARASEGPLAHADGS